MELRITVKSNSFEKGLLPAEVETVDKTGAVDGPSKDLDREVIDCSFPTVSFVTRGGW